MSNFSSTYPSVSPTWQCNFAANGGRIDPRATFSRSDSPIDATKAAASAVHYWSNEKHLSSENLITYSNDVSQSNWVKDGVTETGGQTAPDGGTDAYKLTENTANDEHRIYQAASERITASGSLTVSVYLKYIGRQWAVIRLTDSTGTDRRVWFDIQNGTKGTEETNMTGSITASGNGYYKCVATISSVAASPGTYLMIGGADADNSYVYAGSGSDAFAVWGIQASSTGETVLNETSGQIARSYAPTLKSVSTAGAARFEYDPTDGQSEGILVESQFQELLTYTEDLTNAAYTKSNLTIGSNAAISPDGTLTADLCTESDDSSGQDHSLIVTSPTLSAATHTLSVFAKSAGRSHVQLQAYMGSIALNCQATYSLTDGSVSGLTNATGSAESLGNGWYRLKMHFTPTGSAVAGLYFRLCSDASTNNYTGNGYSGAIMWGANLTQSSHAYSYLKADAAATTKAADSLSCVLSDVGYTGGPFSLGADFSLNGKNSTANGVAAVQDSSSNALIINVGSDNLRAFADVAGATAINTTIEAGVTTDTDYSVFARWDTNDYRGASNGTLGNTDTVCPLPAFDSPALHIGGYLTNYELNGHVKRVALYNEALTDTNLQALTS